MPNALCPELLPSLLVQAYGSRRFLLFPQVDYYGETTRLFTHLVSANPSAASIKSDEKCHEEVDALLGEIKSLSIVRT